MAAQIEVELGVCQTRPLEFGIEVKARRQLLQPFRCGEAGELVPALSQHPGLRPIEGGELLIEASAQGVDQQGAQICGAAGVPGLSPVPLGPGLQQLAHQAILQCPAPETGLEAGQPAAVPVQRQFAAGLRYHHPRAW